MTASPKHMLPSKHPASPKQVTKREVRQLLVNLLASRRPIGEAHWRSGGVVTVRTRYEEEYARTIAQAVFGIRQVFISRIFPLASGEVEYQFKPTPEMP